MPRLVSSMDAIALWTKSGAPLHEFEFENQNTAKTIRQILSQITELDKSIEYLRQVQRDGIYWKLMFRLDLALSNWYYNGTSLLNGNIIWISSKLREDIKKLDAQRDELITTLGSLLSHRKVFAGPFVMSNFEGDLSILPRFRLSGIVFPWLGLGVGSILILRLVKSVSFTQLYYFGRDCWEASRYLLQDWIINPLVEIWKTIRYRGSHLALVSTSALKADVESLERMVLNFAQKHYPNVTPSEVLEQVRNGDVTLMLRRYETELQAPLRNVLLGDMVTMLLIQVQKSKVDLESAVMAMDRLLKANELNFELFAVIPLIALIYFAVGTGRHYFYRLLGRSERHLLNRLRHDFSYLQYVLNLERDSDYILGATLLAVQRILLIWQQLSYNNRWRRIYDEEFYRDLSELLEATRSSESKFRTITRMYTLYPFLQNLSSQ